MSDPTEISAAAMAQRDGTDRPRRRAVIVVLSAVLATAFLVWLGWVAWFHGDPAIDANVSSFDVVSTHEVRVKVAVRFRDADTDGSCLVRATASDHTVVGELNLTADQLRAAKGGWISIRTERRATTAALVRCTGNG